MISPSATLAVLFGLELQKQQSRVILKGFEDLSIIKSKSINRARLSQFWDMKENICKFVIL